MGELAFLGLQATCPTLEAWEESVTDFVTVAWVDLFPQQRRGKVCILARQKILDEVIPIIGYGGTVVVYFHGHSYVMFDESRSQVNPSLYDQLLRFNIFRLNVLMGELGFVQKSTSGLKCTDGVMLFARKKLICDRPFIIKIELPEQFEATSDDPYQ